MFSMRTLMAPCFAAAMALYVVHAPGIAALESPHSASITRPCDECTLDTSSVNVAADACAAIANASTDNGVLRIHSVILTMIEPPLVFMDSTFQYKVLFVKAGIVRI